MVKAGKWIKSILIGGKKDKDKVQKEKQNSSKQQSAVIKENPTTPIVITPSTPKEKKRWSFRRSSATAPKDSNSTESTPTKPDPPAKAESPARVEIAITTAEADATNEKAGAIQDAAAIKIQSVFRSYLARKALRALRGLVKLQALVRGRLVRKRATATLRCMEALITAQARARAQRIRSVEEGKLYNNHRHSNYNLKNSYHEVEKGMMEENIKIVEMDNGGSKNNSNTRNNNNNNYSYYQNNERRDDRFSTHYESDNEYTKQDYKKISPAPSAITDISPRTCSAHFEDYSVTTAQSIPQCYYTAISKSFAFPHQEYAESLSYDYPNYMANTKSSRAKARSQSAPKQRPDSVERQLSKRRPSLEGRNIPRAVRMQRSSSNVGATAQNHHCPPWSVKLDKSTVSLIDSECGSTCSVLTNTNYCRSGVPYDHQGNRY